nr:hypothetical protein [Tanacetum cinerariifolium]
TRVQGLCWGSGGRVVGSSGSGGEGRKRGEDRVTGHGRKKG